MCVCVTSFKITFRKVISNKEYRKKLGIGRNVDVLWTSFILKCSDHILAEGGRSKMGITLGGNNDSEWADSTWSEKSA
jgi:hypothetical protein